MIEDGIGQFAPAKNRNGGRTRELDHLGGFRIKIRLLLRLPTFGELWHPICHQLLFCLARKVLLGSPGLMYGWRCRASLGWTGETPVPTRPSHQCSWRRGMGPALGRIKRQEQGGIARSPGLAPRAITLEASGNLDAPGVGVRKDVQVRGCSVSCGCAALREGRITASGMIRQSKLRHSNVRQSSVPQSARHRSGRSHQFAFNQVVEECQQPEPGPARMAETTRMRSFASPAARVLRSEVPVSRPAGGAQARLQ